MAAVAILGAGLSGVLMGIRLRAAGLEDFVIYERQHDVGGTWLRNTYPGLHCDIPSHLYCYSFEPNPQFSLVYSGQAEIQAYLRRCAEKHRVLGHVRFETTIETACYDATRGCYRLEVSDGTESEARVVVAATGGLTAPYVPRIEGREEFSGPSWHSGAWRHDVALEGKRVAVVGSAASAVQVVPEVAKRAREVVVFSRTPNWVTPRRNAHYTEAEQAALRCEAAWRRVRRRQYRRSLLWHGAFTKRPRAIAALRREVMTSMRSAIDDPALVAALTPAFDPGVKRILVSDDYYPALAQSHVTLVPHGVSAMTATALVAADGSDHPADIAIFCTGYRLGGREDGSPAVEVQGRGGQHLRDALARAPEAYRGVAIPGFPNYFTVCGINGAPGHAPVFLPAESATEYIARWIRRILGEDLKSVEVRADVTRRYNAVLQAELQTMSWADERSGWYRDRAGRVIPFHPGTWCRLRRELRRADDGDFAVEPRAATGREGSGPRRCTKR